MFGGAKMKALLFAFFLTLFVPSVYADTTLSNYWTYQEYLALNPGEKAKAVEFSKRVREAGQPVLPDGKAIKVAMVYPGKQASEYWWRSVSSFEARLRELRLPYEIHPFFSAPGKEVRLQEMQIAEALKGDPDYLVFTLDALRHQVIIERILAKGRPKLILQNITTPVKAWGENQPFLYVGFDHGVGSLMLAESFKELFPQGSSYSLFYGPRGYVSSMRGGTFKEAVAANSDSRVSDAFYLDFNRERAKKAALHLFKRNRMPPFVYACSTDLALGVIDAAKEVGKLDQVSINGWGGGGNELRAILDGELDFTVMRMNDDNGVAMADAIALDVSGQANKVPTVYSGDMELVVKGMTREQIDNLSKRAFRYSDHWKTQTDKIVVYDGT